ncbi:carbohydrate-binding family V/XII protein [Clostridium paraputrificum]|nr:carbohydrate-binding family V/XII protein [Clostridium paraputrificum]
MTYEDETSLQDRINYINDNGYGGLIVWDCSGDDVKGGWPMHTIMFNGLIKDGSETPPTQNTLKAASLTAGPVSNGKYTLTAIVPAYNTATSYQILEGNTVISSGTLNSGSQTPITINYDITGKESGTYNYTVVLSDGSSKVTSTEVKVTVSAPVENTLQAASLTAGQVSGGSFTLNIQIPANNTATSYQILEGNTVISTGSLTVGSALRNISYNVTGKGEGNYNYTVVLSDGSKTVTSNIVSVSVQKPSSYPAWEAWVSYKTGDIVSYNGKNYTCRQGHTSLVGWEPSNVQALWSLI